MAKILIVDDENDIVEFFSRILHREGFQVLAAVNGRDCMRMAEVEHPDLVLLDINMPEMDGGDIAENLSGNEKTKDIPVIFLSGLLSKDEEGYVRGRLFISKTSDTAEIIRKIKDALGTKP